MKRISKAVREEAIEALLCVGDVDGYLSDVVSGPGQVQDLMLAAWRAVRAEQDSLPAQLQSVAYPWCYLEAAALLLDGWNPGDPVEVCL